MAADVSCTMQCQQPSKPREFLQLSDVADNNASIDPPWKQPADGTEFLHLNGMSISSVSTTASTHIGLRVKDVSSDIRWLDFPFVEDGGPFEADADSDSDYSDSAESECAVVEFSSDAPEMYQTWANDDYDVVDGVHHFASMRAGSSRTQEAEDVEAAVQQLNQQAERLRFVLETGSFSTSTEAHYERVRGELLSEANAISTNCWIHPYPRIGDCANSASAIAVRPYNFFENPALNIFRRYLHESPTSEKLTPATSCQRQCAGFDASEGADVCQEIDDASWGGSLGPGISMAQFLRSQGAL